MFSNKHVKRTSDLLESVYREVTKTLETATIKGNREKRIITIEGNIGAGKSTLLEQIRQRIAADSRIQPGQIVCMQEPVDLWESVKEDSTGESILKKFYKEPAKYAFAFQVMAYTSRLAAFQRINPDCEVILCERSLEADRNIFAKMLRDDGMIDEVSYKVYQMLYDNTAGAFPIDTVIYLDVSPEVCLERIGRRARDGEGQISLEYLSRCDEYYKEWMRIIDRPVAAFQTLSQPHQMEEADDDDESTAAAY